MNRVTILLVTNTNLLPNAFKAPVTLYLFFVFSVTVKYYYMSHCATRVWLRLKCGQQQAVFHQNTEEDLTPDKVAKSYRLKLLAYICLHRPLANRYERILY